MIFSIILMIIAALIIYISCEYFVNGIEWIGKVFNISENAVGTVLAAFGTALPESIVTLIAVVFGTNADQKNVGVGAALGGPLVLSTIAYAVVGLSILIFRSKRKTGVNVEINPNKLSRDQLWFMCIFIFKVGLGFVVFAIKPLMGFLFLFAYFVYSYKELKTKNTNTQKELALLKFSPKSPHPSKAMIMLQTILSLVLIFIGSQLFVQNLNTLSAALGVPALIISLLLSPVATELPEILNAVIWVRQGKETLALANISGSMMIQATIPSALGIIFTPWIFDQYLTLSAVVTFVAIFFLWLTLKKRSMSARRLALNSALYLVFLAGFCYLRH